MSLDDLLQEMGNIFDHPMGRMELRRKFETREWKKEESFNEYWHDKIILGNRISLQENELIEYLVDGIPSDVLRNQARMQSFTDVQEVLKAFRKISLTPEVTKPSSNTSPRNNAPGKTNRIATNKGQVAPSTKPTVREAIRCYAYGQTGHYSKDCSMKEKRVNGKDAESKKTGKNGQKTSGSHPRG